MSSSEIESLFQEEKWYLKGKTGFILFILIGFLSSALTSCIQICFNGVGNTNFSHDLPSQMVPSDHPMLIYLLPN